MWVSTIFNRQLLHLDFCISTLDIFLVFLLSILISFKLFTFVNFLSTLNKLMNE